MKTSKSSALNSVSKPTRNFLRGLYGNTSHRSTVEILEKIRKNKNSSEYKRAVRIIRNENLFEGNPVCRSFSNKCPKVLKKYPLLNRSEIIEDVNGSRIKILELVSLYNNLLTEINKCNYAEAVNIIRIIIKNKGVSCFLMRLILFINKRVEDNEENIFAYHEIDKIIIEIEMANIPHLTNAIRELSSIQTDYFGISKRIISNNSLSPENVIAENLLNLVCINDEKYLKVLNSYYSISLFDAFLFIFVQQRFNLPFSKDISSIDHHLVNSFKNLEKIKVNLDPFLKNTRLDEVSIDFFRESFLLIELMDCFLYRSVHASLFNGAEAKGYVKIPYLKASVDRYFYNIASLEDIKTETSNSINIMNYSANESSYIENSTALIYYLDQSDGDISDENRFVRLMSSTRDIASICSTGYLRKIEENCKSDELELVVCCLLAIRENSNLAEHKLRHVLQKIAKNSFNSNLIDLIKYTNKISPAVTTHLVNICDETFLTKLFQLTSKPIDAIDVRADLLEWYGRLVSDNKFIDRAKNLRVDIQLSKQRGALDDARIYVDPVKFTQWIEDNVLNDMSLVLPLASEKKQINTAVIDWSNVDVGLSSKNIVCSNIKKCYREFCENQLFGIASYLGRRIRHGTIEGTGLTEVRELLNKDKYAQLFADEEFLEYYKRWLAEYEEVLLHIKKQLLYIRSKQHQNGKIFSEPNSDTKASEATKLYVELHNYYLSKNHLLGMPNLITEYCWRMIEEDLVDIRKTLSNFKSKSALFKIDQRIRRKLANYGVVEFTSEVNEIVTQKFMVIDSWFHRPSFATPSADLSLLFDAVCSEIKQTFKDYEPHLKKLSNPVIVNGGQYYAIYDALYVIIYNAAKYGLKNGILNFNVSHNKKRKVLWFIIQSQVKGEMELKDAESKISEAFKGDFHGANLYENKSGIKKLRLLEAEGHIKNISYKCKKPNVVQISFHFNIS